MRNSEVFLEVIINKPKGTLKKACLWVNECHILTKLSSSQLSHSRLP